MKTSKIEAKNKSKTFLSSKMETAMNEKYIDLMETSINEKNFHIEEWEHTKARLGGELESRNLKIPSFGKKNMADFIIPKYRSMGFKGKFILPVPELEVIE